MRTPRAFLHAMRTRRTHRIGPAEADQLVAGDHPGHAPLQQLLAAACAPATADELRGEKAAVAAFTAHRRSAARAARRTWPGGRQGGGLRLVPYRLHGHLS